MQKVPAILLAVLLALWGVIFYAVMSPPQNYPGAGTHPGQSEMHVAGSAAEFDAGMIVAGAVAGVLMICVLLLCLLLGTGKNGANRKFLGLVAVSSCPLIVAFLAVTCSFQSYLTDPSPPLFAGFPIPTAWMVYGISLSPLIFLVIYIGGFHRWVMTASDQQRLDELVASGKQHAAGNQQNP